ncbi:hypothetical protein ANSO36C_02590 [Nostoc cf. commune SO-36]|uniref:Uncharacterized protein n=1 Tax=Nostoc cf. commune SO-36 TaxID=449208 RepID=A0ABM7YV07_NOSCO|nr:hypothetical protein [Nostoc commune]BDI14457.1 hypothetical protein ANSO36C_02590 [Nostoc cf. commune SO-36]
MIFGVAKAIEREHRASANYDVLIVDLGEVTVLEYRFSIQNHDQKLGLLRLKQGIFACRRR